MTPGETLRDADGTNRPGAVAGLSRPALRHRLFRRPICPRLVGKLGGAGRLWPVARHLLHVLDLLRRGRPRRDLGHRLHPDLHRPGPGGRGGLSDAAQDGAAGQAAQRHLDRRLPRLALRQEPHRRRHRHPVRHGRRAALHRAPAAGRVVDVPLDRRADAGGGQPARRGPHRHLADRRRLDGGVHHPVRRAQRAGLRAAPRHDAGDRLRIGGQAPGVAHRRSVRAVRAVQRSRRPVDPGRKRAGGRRPRRSARARRSPGW